MATTLSRIKEKIHKFVYFLFLDKQGKRLFSNNWDL